VSHFSLNIIKTVNEAIFLKSNMRVKEARWC